MSGDKKQRGQKHRSIATKSTEKDEPEDMLATHGTEESGLHENTTQAGCDTDIRYGLENISKEIRCLKSEIRKDFHAFGQILRGRELGARRQMTPSFYP